MLSIWYLLDAYLISKYIYFVSFSLLFSELLDNIIEEVSIR